jgi:hypothetical protein
MPSVDVLMWILVMLFAMRVVSWRCKQQSTTDCMSKRDLAKEWEEHPRRTVRTAGCSARRATLPSLEVPGDSIRHLRRKVDIGRCSQHLTSFRPPLPCAARGPPQAHDLITRCTGRMHKTDRWKETTC